MGELPPPAVANFPVPATGTVTADADAPGTSTVPISSGGNSLTAVGCVSVADGSMNSARATYPAVATPSTIAIAANASHIPREMLMT
jgi:hypothetical protein